MIQPILTSPYVPLWCKSNYSFLEGASHPEELVEEAAHLAIRSIAITDRDGVYGVVRAHVKARECGVRLVIGSEVTVEDDSTIVLLAMNAKGYANLCELITDGRLRSEKGTSKVSWREVCSRAEGLIALWGGDRSLIARATDPLFVAKDLRDAFGDRLYAMIVRHRRAEEAQQEHRVRLRAIRYGLPTVAGLEVLYHTRERRDLQDVLTCIRRGVPLSRAGRLTKPNAEHVLKPPFVFRLLFEDDPLTVVRTVEAAERCTFSLDELRYRYPSEKLPNGTTSSEWLRHLTFEGAKERYPLERYPDGIPANVVAQLDKELALVNELEYDGYFLTMWEIVQFCRRSGILCQGRGSAANSAVCYCLGITAVDPVQMDLLFERFISRERAEPPDIDLDIEHSRREEVIQYVYEKYGRSHAAMVANVVRYRARSAIREVGKVLEIPDTTLDRVAKLLSHYDDITHDALDRAGFDPENAVHQHLARLAAEIQDFPRHLSIHPGGFLLGHKPVRKLVPIENATMPGRTVIQWDKDDLESLGLFKVDLLGLGMLSVLSRSFDSIEEHYGKRMGMADVPDGDEPTFEMIRRADTVGVFQIESRAQMAMLPRLKPRNYYDIVIEVSIVRPGPITGGMVHPYLRRRNGEEEVIYPHPSLEPVLKKTLGVPLFQEQVMKLAVVAADYTPGEADQLRRDMAAWRREGRLDRHRERLVSRMLAKGITKEFAERVFEQIRGFGDYGFPESHAASFAYIAYVSAWLKRHYPEVFVCALLNAQPMGFYSPSTIIDDAKRRGARVLPVDVQASRWDCTLERFSVGGNGGSGGLPPRRNGGNGRRPASGNGGSPAGTNAGHPASETEASKLAVRVGLRYVRSFHEEDGRKIEAAQRQGPFKSIDDFLARTGLEEGALTRLAEAGAFERFEPHRRSVLWAIRGRDRATVPRLVLADREPRVDFLPLNEFETIGWDYDATGHSTRGHPLSPVREELRSLGLPDARTVTGTPDGRRLSYAGIVINRQRPSTAKGVVFMTLEDETGFVNVVIWKNVFQKHMVLAKTASFLGVSGKIQSDSGVVHLVAESLWDPVTREKPRKRRSRDFH
jgi:error-prone DNA polymerase